jgi:hypothetical protein
MPRLIVKKKDYYLEWSTIVDAPVIFGRSLEDFKKYYKEEYGNAGMLSLPDRLSRVEGKEISAQGYDVNELIEFNRSGPEESCLTMDEIYSAYCLRKPIRNNWLPD